MTNIAVRTLYAELLDLCLAQQHEALPLSASFITKTVSGHLYHYAQFPDLQSGKQRQVYLGRDSDELRERIARYRARQEEVQADAQPRRQIVRAILAAGGFRPEVASGRLLEFLAEIGLFHAGAVLVGTHAFGAYANSLGLNLAHHHTQDVDLAAPLQVAVNSPLEKLESSLKRFDADFFPVPGLHPLAPSTSFKVRGSTTRLDILTPLIGKPQAGGVAVPSLGTFAEPLRHLDYLTEAAEPAVLLHGAGILVHAPVPARYALHKLIVAVRRPAAEAAKREKDLLQAQQLLEYFLADDPHTLKDAIADLKERKDGAAAYVPKALPLLPPPVRARLSMAFG
jgi:hypothetical protein